MSDGTHYSEEDIEFMLAMDRFKRERQIRFPTWQEVLNVLRSLGWRKIAPLADPERVKVSSPVGGQ